MAKGIVRSPIRAEPAAKVGQGGALHRIGKSAPKTVFNSASRPGFCL